jgi:hypothetical protein
VFIFPVLVSCTKKNLATLVRAAFNGRPRNPIFAAAASQAFAEKKIPPENRL